MPFVEIVVSEHTFVMGAAYSICTSLGMVDVVGCGCRLWVKIVALKCITSWVRIFKCLAAMATIFYKVTIACGEVLLLVSCAFLCQFSRGCRLWGLMMVFVYVCGWMCVGGRNNIQERMVVLLAPSKVCALFCGFLACL